MGYAKTSWIPLSRFTKSECHFDWMVGVGNWKKVKDALTGGSIKPLETIFWNRALGNLSVGLQAYLKARKEPQNESKLKSLGLPLDINIS